MLQEIEHKIYMDDIWKNGEVTPDVETLKQQLFNLYKYRDALTTRRNGFCHNVDTSSFG